MSDPPRSLESDATVPAPLDVEAAASVGVARPRLAGRYEILSLLGVGGMGSVYRARDVTLDELVALKVLKKELAAVPGMVARFRQEVKLARRVTHRNVARTFDIGEDGGDTFLTMELVDGEPLGTIAARRGRLPLAFVVEVASGVCAGLAAAHAAGVIHRDLKPENVLVAKDGRVAITDFGIARALAVGEAGRTLGAAAGTPVYMAPEQVEGKQDLDARCDIYALGAMLFELLTGRVAWPGESVVAIAAARLIHPPPDPRSVASDVSDHAAALVMKCMARDRKDRFASAEEVATALAGLTVPAKGLTMPPPVRVAPGHAGQKTVAVLPIANVGPAEDAYLADALFDDLIDLLSVVEGLRVRPRGASARFSGRETDPREAGRALGVQVVVEGSLRRVGEALRIHVRLVTVEDGFQLWAKRFDRKAAEFLSVGDEVARAVGDALTVDAHAAPRAMPTDPVALDLYMRGRYEYHRAWFTANTRALELLEQAYNRAPKDARIVAGYALALVRKYSIEEAPGFDDVALARVEEALALDPDLAEARVGLATLHIYRGEVVVGAQQLRAALLRSPSAPDALDWKGRLLVEVGRPREGIACLERALALEPHLGHIPPTIARVRALLGEWQTSDEFWREMPENANDATMSWITRARLVMWRSDPALGRALFADFEARGGAVAEPYRTSIRSMVRLAETHTLTPELLADVSRTLPATKRVPWRGRFFAQIRTEVMCAIGDLAMAKRMLHDADALGLCDVVWLDSCPLLAAIRGDPDVQAVRVRVEGRAARIREALGVA
jgi:eukaryotic-like serine/threonine-protein kinase